MNSKEVGMCIIALPGGHDVGGADCEICAWLTEMLVV